MTDQNRFKIVNTRPRHQSTELTRKLRGLKTAPIEFPTIEISEPDDWGPVDESITELSRYDWLVFTSQNGVEKFVRRAISHDVQPPDPFPANTAAIGPSTANRLEAYGLTVDVCPDEFRSECLAKELVQCARTGAHLLLPRSNISRPVLVDTLEQNGLRVTEVHPYHLTKPVDHSSETINLLREKIVHMITFTSSMTVENFHELIREYDLHELQNLPAACIGPITADTARDKGFKTPVVADEYTLDGLVKAIARSLPDEPK